MCVAICVTVLSLLSIGGFQTASAGIDIGQGISTISDVICNGYALAASCKFYDCYEMKKHCGSDGYLLGYGKKYCEASTSAFDSDGQTWAQCVRRRLIEFLQPKFNQDWGSCSEINSAAFANHAQAYLDCGFCKICKTNKAALFKLYDFKDFLSLKAVSQVYQVMRKCGIFTCFW